MSVSCCVWVGVCVGGWVGGWGVGAENVLRGPRLAGASKLLWCCQVTMPSGLSQTHAIEVALWLHLHVNKFTVSNGGFVGVPFVGCCLQFQSKEEVSMFPDTTASFALPLVMAQFCGWAGSLTTHGSHVREVCLLVHCWLIGHRIAQLPLADSQCHQGSCKLFTPCICEGPVAVWG